MVPAGYWNYQENPSPIVSLSNYYAVYLKQIYIHIYIYKLCVAFSSLLLKKVYFEISVDSYAFVRNNTGRSHTPGMFNRCTSAGTLVYHKNF